MKQKIIFIIFFISITVLSAQTNILENYQVTSFEGVTRLSFTFTQRPITNILKEANSLRMTINVPNCGIGNMPASFTTPDMFARRIELSRVNRDLNIVISTDSAFEIFRQSAHQGRQYTLHIDIVRFSPPRHVPDFVSLLDYYHFNRDANNLNQTLNSIPTEFLNHPQIVDRRNNRFTSPRIFTPRPIAQTSVRPVVQTPARPTTTPTAPTTPPTTENATITPQTEVRQPQSQPGALPPVAIIRNTDISDASLILMTRNDRFPSRIPQTKNIFRPQNAPTPPTPPSPPPVEREPTGTPPQENIPERVPEPTPIVPPPPPVVVADPEPAYTPAPVIVEPQIITRTVLDIADLEEIEKQILHYFNIVKVDPPRADFMVGVNANIAGDYRTSVDFLRRIPQYDINYEEAIRWLYDSYTELGDIANATFYASLLFQDDNNDEPTDFINIPIKLWMAGAIGLIAMVIGFVIASTKNKKNVEEKSRPSVSDDELSIHRKNLERAYDNKDIYNKEVIETSTDVMDKKIADNYDDPPIVTESLNAEEEEELIREEKISFPSAKSQPTEPEPEEEEDDYSGFYDEGYKKKMVLRLYNDDGWKVDEIAKELQLSQREIEFILKMNQ
jgi:hypothetical protein